MIALSNELLNQVTVQIGNEPVRIKKCFCIGPVVNPSENDYCNDKLENIFASFDFIVQQDCKILMKNNLSYQGFYHDKKLPAYESIDFGEYDLSDKVIYAFANIFSANGDTVVLRFGNLCRMKVWINGNIVLNLRMIWNDNSFVLYQLNKGNNTIIVEIGNFYDEYDRDRKASFTLRINKYDANSKKSEGNEFIFDPYMKTQAENKIYMVEQDWDHRDQSFHDFILIKKDYISNIENDVVIYIEDMYGKKIDRIKAKLNVRTSIDLDKIRKKHTCSVLVYKIHYKANNLPFLFETLIQIGEVSDIVLKLRKRYDKIKMEKTLKEEDRLNIEGRLNQLDLINTRHTKRRPIEWIHIRYFRDFYFEILQLLEYYDAGKGFDAYLNKTKYATYFFLSKLDDTEEIINVRLPEHYNPSKKYPLILFSFMCRYSWYSRHFREHYPDAPAILIDITCRGYTMGSYIGEAAFLEALNLIKSRFHIDEDRVYMIGYTTGGYAVWSMEQAYPDLFAATVNISGEPYVPNLLNLVNVNILNISGKKDAYYKNGFEMPNKVLSENNHADFKSILIDEADDNTLYPISCNKFLIEWLLQYKRNPEPEYIFFRTERYRHRKAYWLTINHMEDGKNYATIEGNIESDSYINIKTENIASFSLERPNKIQQGFCVTVDHKVYYFTNEQKITFNKEGNNYTTKINLPGEDAPAIGSKGMGILDVYLDSMRVIIPSVYGSETERENIQAVAQMCSKPFSSGQEPKLYVNYPIVEIDHIKKHSELLTENNLVTIGFMKFLDKNCSQMLLLKPNGFIYNKEFFEGDYCILYIAHNPYNFKHRILCIYANNEKLYKKCLFTRRIIIPTYSGGLNEYLNSEAIILYQGKYYTINHWGNPLVSSN